MGRSTRNRLNPKVLLETSSKGVVLVSSTIPFARSAPEMNIFCPLITYSSPSFTAIVLVFRVFVPASASVKAKQNSIPSAIFGRYFSFCPSSPCFTIVKPPKTEVKHRNHSPANPQPSEVRVSMVKIISNIPSPPPPYFSGIITLGKPASIKVLQKSSGNS